MGPDASAHCRQEVRLAVSLTGGRLLSVVRGLWLARIRVAVGRTVVWVEVPLPGSPFDAPALFAARTAAVRSLAGDALPWLVLPSPDGLTANAFVYAGTRGGDVLAEAGSRRTGETFVQLGRQLAEIHGIPVPEPSPLPTEPVVHPLAELDRPDDGGVLHALQRGLATVPAVSGPAMDAERAPGARVLLHGRWSMGTLLVGTGAAAGPEALGGPDCWLGPREHDIGYLIAELFEEAADAGADPRDLAAEPACAAVEQFVAGYRSRASFDSSLVLVHTAHRVVSHLAANGRWRATAGCPPLSVREVVTLLTFVEAASPWLREMLG